MLQNVFAIVLGNIGWSACFVVIGPLMQLDMREAGVPTSVIGLLTSINSWLVAFLVMYFSWRSDRTRSRFGRRVPYLFISTPFIAICLALFPFVGHPASLAILFMVQALFMDMKASTYPLLSIDCVPRHFLARMNAINAASSSLINFGALTLGMRLAETHPWLPYVAAAGILLTVTAAAGLIIREPAVEIPQDGTAFKPWSALAIGCADRRRIVLMVGVALLVSFMACYTTFVWLYADSALGMARSEVADALRWGLLINAIVAFPVGWIIDRFGSWLVISAYLVLIVVTCAILLGADGRTGLMIAAVMATCVAPLYNAADILVYRTCPPAHVGSVTSSNAFIRNAWVGILVVVVGVMADWPSLGYQAGFISALCCSFMGVIVLVIYHRMTRQQATTTVSKTDSLPSVRI
jgi:MFS family permease